MERNKEARRASIVGSNGFNRRNCRTNTLRDSPDEDSGVELQESTKSRDRLKKDRDRESERDRGRDIKERDGDLRERFGRSKRRRAERMTSNRDNIVRDETSDESENEDLDDETTTSTTSAVTGVRFLPTAAGSVSNNHHSHNHSSSLREHQHNSCNGNINNIISGNHHLQHRKNFLPIPSSSSKSYRAAPVWKAGDEMIGISVPRKARSASTKRLHDLASNSSHNNIGGGGCGVTGGDQILRQTSAPPMSPSSSNASTRRKLKPNCANGNGTKPTPPKVMSKPSSSNPEELEIEIAEVLYGLMNQSQAPSSKNEDSREVSRSKSRASLSNPNSTSANNPISGPNSTPLSAVAPKRKKPRQILENSSRISPKPEMDQTPKSGSTAENVYEIGGNLVNSQVHPGHPPEEPESMNLDPESKPVMAELLKERRDLVAKEETSSPKDMESPAARTEDSNRVDSASIATASVSATEIKENPEIENVRQEKFHIDLMASPPQVRSSPKRDTVISSAAAVVDEMPVLSVLDIEFLKDKENVNGKRWREESVNVAAEVKKGKAESEMGIENKVRNIDLIKLELEKGEKDGVGRVNATGLNSNKEDVEPLTEKTGQSTNSLPLPMSMASWPGGLPSMGYMAPLQSVAPMDGTTVTPTPLQQSFAQPRPKKCATHCYIARNIHSLQQFMKMNPFWPAAVGPTTLFGLKPCALSVVPNADVQNVSVRGVLNGHGQDKGQSVGNAPVHGGGGKEKGSQTASSHDYDYVQNTQQQQQIPIQQALPPVPPSSPLAPAFNFPLNQQAMAAAVSAQPAVKSPSGPTTATSSNLSNSATSSAPTAPTTAMSFNYPNIPINETQYLAILQNNGYLFTMPPIGAPSNYRGTLAQAMPLLSSPFYPSQMIHPSQIQPPSTQSHQNASVSASQKNSQSTENFLSQKSQISQNELNHHMKQPRHVESEPGSDDSRNLRNIYGHNFTMSQNFSLMSGGGNQSEKKPEQPHQAPHSFAMTFGSMNGSMGIDVTTMAQNHAFFQRFPEASRPNMQMMMAAAPKKSSSSKDDERKNSSAKSQTQSELADAPNGVIEGPTRSPNVASGPDPNVASGPAWSSQTTTGNGGGSVNATNTHIQSQLQQQQMLQLKQHQQQQQQNNWNKTQATSNGSLYSENLNSSSTMAAKFPNSLSGFTQNLVQNSNNTRNAPTSQAPSSFALSTASNLKNLPQQHNSQIQSQLHAQISFGGNHKCSKNSQGNQTTLNNQAGSPTTSSMSKGASGSPRATNSASTNNKMGQASTFSAQQAQNSQAQKSLSNSGAKPQSQQMAKNMQQAQLYFSNAFSQAQSHSTGSNSGPGGYFAQQSRRPDQPPGGPGPSVNGMLSLGSMGTNDPAKAIAAAICNLKGSGLSSSQAQSIIHAQFSALPAGFTYVHPVSTAVQTKHAEQKQPAGQPEK